VNTFCSGNLIIHLIEQVHHTDHIWTVQRLLAYQVPLSPWESPKQRGRPLEENSGTHQEMVSITTFDCGATTELMHT